MTKTKLRPGTNKHRVFQTMENVQHHNTAFAAPPDIPDQTVRVCVSQLKKEHFEDADFYTRTVDGKLMIGIWDPA